MQSISQLNQLLYIIYKKTSQISQSHFSSIKIYTFITKDSSFISNLQWKPRWNKRRKAVPLREKVVLGETGLNVTSLFLAWLFGGLCHFNSILLAVKFFNFLFFEEFYKSTLDSFTGLYLKIAQPNRTQLSKLLASPCNLENYYIYKRLK